LDEDVTDAAATALAAIGGEPAASQLRSAAKQAQGNSRRNLIDALAALAEPQSADIFTEALADQDREVRIAAAAGLANIGRADAVEPLFKAADAAQGWERTQLTKACLVLAEKLAAASDKPLARRIYERLQKNRTGDNERHIRDAAEFGLAAIAR
jgi:HEAT repeat protein